MSRLADPSICPDCRSTLDPSSTCTGCGLRLDGPSGERLWQAMLGADRLVQEIRAAASVALAATTVTVTAGATGHLPAAPPLPPRRPRRRLPVASVPGVLLSLGALCLLVAATVFVAIAWGSLGITGRTLVLLGVTAAVGGLAAAVTRRGLRAAAESLWTIAAGMLVLDLLAARAAGLAGLDSLGWRATSVLVGGILFVVGVAVSLWVHRTPVREVWAPQVIAVLGACVAAAAGCWLAPDSELGSALAAPVLLLLALGLRSRLPGLATGLLGLALFSWFELTLLGVTSSLEPATWAAWWSELRGWPLAIAAGYAAAVAAASRLPEWVRSVAAGAALGLLAVLANAPITPATPTRDAVVLVGTVVALALVAAVTSQLWARAATVVGVVIAAVLVGQLVWQPLSVLEVLPSEASVTAHLPAVASAAAPWTWILVGLGSAAWALAATRTVRVAPRGLGWGVSCAAVAIGVAVAAIAAQPPLWAAAVATLVASGMVAVATWSRRTSWSPVSVAITALGAGYLLVVGTALAVPSPALTAGSSTVVCLLMAAAYAQSERRDEVVAPAVTGALAVVAGAYALFAWGATWSTDSRTTAGVMAVFSALVVLAAAPASRRRTSRLTLELASAVPAVAAAVLAPDLDGLALVLTVVGSGLAGVAVLNRDRTDLSWFAACLLGTATALRVLLDVRAPELYTLPAAILLLAAGAWRLRTDREPDSFRVLGAGLALALTPSLLLALQEPVSLRALLVGAGGAAALAWGSQQRIAAPLVAGAGTVALLTLRELEPLAEAVPRWLTLALLGAALLGAGVTWESRLRNLRAAGRYLTALR